MKNIQFVSWYEVFPPSSEDDDAVKIVDVRSVGYDRISVIAKIGRANVRTEFEYYTYECTYVTLKGGKYQYSEQLRIPIDEVVSLLNSGNPKFYRGFCNENGELSIYSTDREGFSFYVSFSPVDDRLKSAMYVLVSDICNCEDYPCCGHVRGETYPMSSSDAYILAKRGEVKIHGRYRPDNDDWW